MLKIYFWMNLASKLGLKITIYLDNKTVTGYLATAKDHEGNFYLYDSKEEENSILLLSQKTEKVARVSLSPFRLKNGHYRNKNNFFSDLSVSSCIPIDGNIPYLEIPFHKILKRKNPIINGYRRSKKNVKRK